VIFAGASAGETKMWAAVRENSDVVSKEGKGGPFLDAIPVRGINQCAYQTRPSFLDRGILAQTVKEEKDISNESNSLGSRQDKTQEDIGTHKL